MGARRIPILLMAITREGSSCDAVYTPPQVTQHFPEAAVNHGRQAPSFLLDSRRVSAPMSHFRPCATARNNIHLLNFQLPTPQYHITSHRAIYPAHRPASHPHHPSIPRLSFLSNLSPAHQSAAADSAAPRNKGWPETKRQNCQAIPTAT